MGSGPSYELANIELVALAKPVAAISLRFCHEELLTLQYKSSTFGCTRTFRNVLTDAVRFTIKANAFSSRQTLFDASDMAVANFRTKTFTRTPIYYTHLGSDHDGDAALEILARYHHALKTEVRVVFTDLLTHEQCELSFEGHWRKRTACFWLVRGNCGVREPVATVRPDGESRSKYIVTIAPHMDAALITIVCAALTQQQRNEEAAAASG